MQWRVSLRTGTLHVTSTLAEEDSSILLVVDAVVDLGVGRGIHGSASSLDVAVRAAGAVAEHYLRRGDRVGLGSSAPPGTGCCRWARAPATCASRSTRSPRSPPARTVSWT